MHQATEGVGAAGRDTEAGDLHPGIRSKYRLGVAPADVCRMAG